METLKQDNGANKSISLLEEAEGSVSTQSPPTRTEILLCLFKRAKWISGKIDNNATQFSQALKTRVYFATVECQIYKAMLYGMKETELVELEREIEEIKQALKERST